MRGSVALGGVKTRRIATPGMPNINTLIYFVNGRGVPTTIGAGRAYRIEAWGSRLQHNLRDGAAVTTSYRRMLLAVDGGAKTRGT
jgi:hypothetical protein